MSRNYSCRRCGAPIESNQDFCVICGVCLHPPTATPPEGTRRVIYSAVLDDETCQSCRAQESRSAADVNLIMPTPNPRCTSLLGCRCFHIYEPDDAITS